MGIITCCQYGKRKQPNILFAISDDQGFPHSSAYGCKFVSTPGFDNVAEKGALFMNTYCAAPQCSPNRASILTGRYIWQNEEAGTHASLFPAQLKVFTDRFIEHDYHLGSTGKPWANCSNRSVRPVVGPVRTGARVKSRVKPFPGMPEMP